MNLNVQAAACAADFLRDGKAMPTAVPPGPVVKSLSRGRGGRGAGRRKQQLLTAEQSRAVTGGKETNCVVDEEAPLVPAAFAAFH